MKTYMFPGQGSQFKGMGAALFDAFPKQVNTTNKILGYSIKELCVDDPANRLNQTKYTQPALYVVNALSYRQKIKETVEVPDFLAGHSLGEYNALEASGAISFKNGLKLVKKRGALMNIVSKGAMAAVIGAIETDIRKILEQNELTGIDMANFNSPMQTVISGLQADIQKALAFFKKEKIRYIPLNTSGAFHSRYMESSKVRFHTYLKRFKFSTLKIPVISNAHALPYKQKDIVANLADQITHSVQWVESIRYLLRQGDMEFEELGVGNVLTNLVAAIRAQTSPLIVEQQTESALQSKDVAGEDETAEAVTETQTVTPIEEIKAPQMADAVDWEQESTDLQKKIEAWNQAYPIGTKVAVKGYEEELETRTEAVILFGQRAGIYVEGHNGYFALDEVTPA